MDGASGDKFLSGPEGNAGEDISTRGHLHFIFATVRNPEDWRFARRRSHLVREQAVLLRR